MRIWRGSKSIKRHLSYWSGYYLLGAADRARRVFIKIYFEAGNKAEGSATSLLGIQNLNAEG
jgi:hypothetical protein